MRIAVGGISHETSTFTPVPTTLESFTDRYLLTGEAMLAEFRETNTPIGGFIERAAELDVDLLPTVFAEAHPGGPASRDVLDQLVRDLTARIHAARPLDGIALDLHGAMVADGIYDCEGYILQEIRRVVGPNIPLVAQLDIHANTSAAMAQCADVLVGRQTYPEVDMAKRGRDCVDILWRLHTRNTVPTVALRQIPMVWGINQVTTHRPMADAISMLRSVEQQPGVICASIATCYPYADVPDMGASTYVATDNDSALACSLADELAQWIYSRRSLWHAPIARTTEILPRALSEGRFPIILADREDNTGAGTPGDSTGMLRAFATSGLEKACVLYIVDPASVEHCHASGVGSTLELSIGGKSHPSQGDPVDLAAEVIAVSDGRFRYTGPMYAGLEGRMGRSAHVRANGMHVILVSEREQPYDIAFSLSLGLDPRKMRVIGVKSQAHFRAGFEPWAGAIHLVREPSVHNPTGGLSYQRRRQPLYPFEDPASVAWRWPTGGFLRCRRGPGLKG